MLMLDGMDEVIINVLVREIQSSERQELGSRLAGLALKYTLIGGINTNKILKERYTSLRSFIDRYSQFFVASSSPDESPTEFRISLLKTAPLNTLPPLPSNVRLSRLQLHDNLAGDETLSDEDDVDDTSGGKPLEELEGDDEDRAMRAAKTGAGFDDDDIDGDLGVVDRGDDDDDSVTDEPALDLIPALAPFVAKPREELMNLLKADLQQLLKENALKVTGGKPELIERYLEWQESERQKWEVANARNEELRKVRLEEAELQRQRLVDEQRPRRDPFSAPRSWSSQNRMNVPPGRNTGAVGAGSVTRTPMGMVPRYSQPQQQGRAQSSGAQGRGQYQLYPPNASQGSSLSNGFNNYRGSTASAETYVPRPPPPTFTTFISPAGAYTAASSPSTGAAAGASLDESMTAGIEPQTVVVMNIIKRYMAKQGIEVVSYRTKFIYQVIHHFPKPLFSVSLVDFKIASRELGRHLASHITKDAVTGQPQSALQYIKSQYNTLLSFVRRYRRVFEAPQPLPPELQDPNHPGEFGVMFVKPPKKTPFPPTTSSSSE